MCEEGLCKDCILDGACGASCDYYLDGMCALDPDGLSPCDYGFFGGCGAYRCRADAGGGCVPQ